MCVRCAQQSDKVFCLPYTIHSCQNKVASAWIKVFGFLLLDIKTRIFILFWLELFVYIWGQLYFIRNKYISVRWSRKCSGFVEHFCGFQFLLWLLWFQKPLYPHLHLPHLFVCLSVKRHLLISLCSISNDNKLNTATQGTCCAYAY